MGKHSKRNRPQPQRTSSPSAVPVSASPGDTTVAELERRAEAEGVIVPAAPAAPPAPGESEADLRGRLAALAEGYATARDRIAERERAVAAKEDALSTRQRDHEASLTSTAAERKRLEAIRTEQDKREQDLLARDEVVRGLEAMATAGFVRQRAALLAPFEEELAQLTRRHAEAGADRQRENQEHLARLDARRLEFEATLERRRQALEDQYVRREADLAQREADLQQEASSVAMKARRAALTEKDVADREAAMDEYVETVVQERAAEIERKGEVARARATDLARQLTDLETKRAREQEALAALGDKRPEAIRAQIQALQETVARLKSELADRPSADLSKEVENLRAERDRWETERRTLQEQRRELEQRVTRLQLNVDQVETLRDQMKALESGKKLLEAALQQLGKEVEDRLEKRDDKPAFPELANMDKVPELGRPPEVLWPRAGEGVSLRQIAQDVRATLATGQPSLYYREEDVRAFLGGLAMSRLHLLQGISGIGKSSLPRAFAEAVGGECHTVSVQAGWRDRNDLFGHYNTFERRYLETGFVQALYRAGREALKDRLVIVLLDEMNLSHPEQYAADLLDVLERTKPTERQFELVSFEPPGASPKGLSKGRFLALPENVWFVGTANHDETTKDFADKTYDRSFVLELPPSLPEKFHAQPPKRTPPLSLKALVAAFDQAGKAHKPATDKANGWLGQHLRPALKPLRIGLAGRIGKQLGAYVPVVLEAGGTLGEALDQVVTTRLLRKLAGRHDTQAEDVESLQKVLRETWPCQETKEPKAAMTFLDGELKRLRG